MPDGGDDGPLGKNIEKDVELEGVAGTLQVQYCDLSLLVKASLNNIDLTTPVHTGVGHHTKETHNDWAAAEGARTTRRWARAPQNDYPVRPANELERLAGRKFMAFGATRF